MTFGQFDSKLNSTSLELVESTDGKKSYLIKSKGFQFNNSYYNFPGKSYLRLDPLQSENGYFTQDEGRFNSSKAAFERIWKELTNNDQHKFTWDETKDVNITVA